MLTVERIVAFCVGALALLKDVIHKRRAARRPTRPSYENSPGRKVPASRTCHHERR